MTRALVTNEKPGVVSILRLHPDSLRRLCDALEAAEFLAGPPTTFGKAANQAYLLNSLRHPKANKLIKYPSEGPQLDLNVFTIPELKSLATSLNIVCKSSERKGAIITKITDSLAGKSGTATVLAAKSNHHNTSCCVWSVRLHWYCMQTAAGTSAQALQGGDLSSGRKSQPDRIKSSNVVSWNPAGKTHRLPARTAQTASQHSYTTATCMSDASTLHPSPVPLQS